MTSIARGTLGFTRAELANLGNESAWLDAKDKVIRGSEKSSIIVSDEQEKLTAFLWAEDGKVLLLNEGRLLIAQYIYIYIWYLNGACVIK